MNHTYKSRHILVILVYYLLSLYVLTPLIAGQNLKNKLGLIKFGNYDKNKAKIYT